MARIFISGFETGDGSEWPVASIGGPAETTIVQSGGYSWKAPHSLGFPFSDTGNIINTNTIYLKLWVYIPGSPSGEAQLFTNGTSATVNTIQVNIDTDNRLKVYNGAAGGTFLGKGTIAIAPNTYTCIQMKTVISATVGSVEIRIGGAVDQTYTGLTNNQAGPITAIQVDNFLSPGGFSQGGDTGIPFYFDNIEADDAVYPDLSSRVITRQGATGTPTYDAWTKNGAATSALCWSDTPFTTATNCSDTVIGDTQTMLVASFNATQSGHGTETISSPDTINGARVVLIGKTAGVPGVNVVFYRLNGVDNGTNAPQFQTSDSLVSTSIFTPSYTDIQSSEIGCQSNLPSLTTVEDVWLMVSYTPGTPPPPPAVGNAYFRTRRQPWKW